VIGRFWPSAKKLYVRVRDIRLNKGNSDTSKSQVPHEAVGQIDTTVGLDAVVASSRFATIAFSAALLLTLAAAIITDGTAQATAQWISTLGFICAWAALRTGVYSRDEEWLSSAVYKSLKWWLFTFAPVGFINLIFAIANKNPLTL